MSTRVSVIVPLYNKAATVERALRSIANQTFRDFEIIVVDDGSTDDSATIAEGFADERISIIRQPNAGPGAARNRGIAASTTEYIAFLDADDEWLPKFLERSIAWLDEMRPNVVAVTCGYVEGATQTPTQPLWRARGLQPGLVRLTSATSPTYVILVLRYMNPWATVVRRNGLVPYGGFYENDCRYAEDSYLWLKVLFNETIYIDLEPLVWWHSEASALSRNLSGVRPVEPFLVDPSGLYKACPTALLNLLHDVLAIRAGKTAAVLSFWGQWREGRLLLRRFTRLSDLRFVWVRIGQLASTRLGSLAGLVCRLTFMRP